MEVIVTAGTEILTAGEKEITVVAVQRKLSKLHCFAHHSDISSGTSDIIR